MSLQILCDTKPTAKGITSQDKITINILAPASNEAIGPTAPTSPKPDEAGVPTNLNNGTVRELTVAVISIGIAITGCFRKFGIIIFIAPKAIAIGTPDLLAFIVAQTSTAVVEATPIEAALADIPLRPIARPIATVEIGLTISIEKAIAIRIDIAIGCKVVKELIP